ncbi:RDD family protein [Streptomyces sp. NPDC127077]|uniref:RDD family protein n=1 Tax=Streptomyces sp. NPDC127077 TaxID=3347131 RepID=UPI003651A422
MSAPTPAPGDDRPREGYYPDPSIPGYVRYWNGAAWVPGTSRPAPSGGEALSPPAAARPAQVPAPASSPEFSAARGQTATPAVEETGPHFFDEDPEPHGTASAEPHATASGEAHRAASAEAQHGSRPEPAASWGADRSRQSGFGGDQDRRVSWGAPKTSGARDPRTAGFTDAVSGPDGASARTDGTTTIPPADSGAAARPPASPSPVVFRRPTGPVPSTGPEGGTGAGGTSRTGEASSGAAVAGAGRSTADPVPAEGDTRFRAPSPRTERQGGGTTPPSAPGVPAGPGPSAAPAGFGPPTASAPSAAPAESGPAAAAAGFGPPAASAAPGPSGVLAGSGSPTAPATSGPSGAPAGAGPFTAPAGSGSASAPAVSGPSGAPAGAGSFTAPAGSVAAAAPAASGPPAAPAAGSSAVPTAGPAAASGTSAAPAGGFGAGAVAPGTPGAVAPGVGQVASGPVVPQQPGGAAPVASGAGGGQPSWAQQVHQLAGDPADEGQRVAPWKPPVDDVFQAAARLQASARPAGLGRRLAARLLDTVVIAGVTTAAAVPLGTRAVDHIDEKIDAAKLSGEKVTVWLLDATTVSCLGAVLAVLLVAGVLYEVLPTVKWGRTLGKKLCGIEVRDIEGHEPPTFGRALGRWLVLSVPSLLVVGLVGVVWCLFDKPWSQCWHDKAAHTFVAGPAR